MTRLLAMCFVFVALAANLVFADVATPTLTKVYFEQDGQAVHEEVEYTVTCDGYHQGFDEPDPVDPTIETVFTYSATCPDSGCNVYENYYMNYMVINSCELVGTRGDDTFTISIGDTPVPEDCSYEPQYASYDGDHYYNSDDEIIDEAAMIFDDSDSAVDEFCEVTYVIPSSEVKIKLYPDVSVNHTNYDAIKYVTDEGIVSGYKDKTFRPSDEINRSEFTKIIVAAHYSEAAINVHDVEGAFTDVTTDDWYNKYINLAMAEGIIEGDGEGLFKPKDTINFAEAAKIIVETFDVDEVQLDIKEGVGLSWYYVYVATLEEYNVLPDTMSSAHDDVTRAEMAEMIYRVMENYIFKLEI